jgi:hypothetical protein
MIDEMIRSSFFSFVLYGIWACLSSQEHAHDIVGAHAWLKRCDAGREALRIPVCGSSHTGRLVIAIKPPVCNQGVVSVAVL